MCPYVPHVLSNNEGMSKVFGMPFVFTSPIFMPQCYSAPLLHFNHNPFFFVTIMIKKICLLLISIPLFVMCSSRKDDQGAAIHEKCLVVYYSQTGATQNGDADALRPH